VSAPAIIIIIIATTIITIHTRNLGIRRHSHEAVGQVTMVSVAIKSSFEDSGPIAVRLPIQSPTASASHRSP
jgi:hypothetical protein